MIQGKAWGIQKTLFAVALLASFYGAELFANPTLKSIHVKTPWDQYELKRQGADYTLNSQKVSEKPLRPLIEIIQTPATAPCPKTFKGDVVLKLDTEANQKILELNLKEGLLKGREGCLLISGSGLDLFPLSKDWFLGLGVQKGLSPKKMVFRSNNENFKAQKIKDEWKVIEKPTSETFNFEFFEKFLQSLESYSVDSYIHERVAEKKPVFRLQIPGKTLIFYQISPDTWALKDSKNPWLKISSTWNFWKDLDSNQWTDTYAKFIEQIRSENLSPEEKQKNIEGLGNIWSESLKRAYHHCLLNDSNSISVRRLCIQKIRQRPTDSNTRAILAMIHKTQEPELIEESYNYLKIQNPKGMKPDKNFPKYIKYWTQWWKQTKHSD
ncbi:MAG: hypothetical protein CL676_07750 [Bdellovibrionaceae bacterium]|nr:hypothetical protein [Pseudobdellovibrionaceae bacterium]|tara:strand:+ start:7642 stop:8787 length:1146 start_codon:yes stop_codon:yes gene_type:complete